MSAPRYYLHGNFSRFKGLFLKEEKQYTTFPSGSILIHPHNAWKHFYYILSGQVKISILEENMEKNLAYCGADYLVPFAVAPDDPIQNLIQVEAISEVQAISITQEQWNDITARTPALKDELQRMLLDYIYLLAHELESQTFDSGMEKTASFLYTVYENTNSRTINIPFHELRSFIGLNRTNLNKYMNALIQNQVIKRTSRQIVILHPEKLKTYCSTRIINCQIIVPENEQLKPAEYDFKQKIIRELYDFLSENFHDIDAVEEYISSLPIDFGYLNRLFKLQYDSTIRTYLLGKRLEYATELLVQTDKKIVDIAYESGFNSVSSFYRSFKENLEISPSEYRMKNPAE